jgi:hypothetical protein
MTPKSDNHRFFIGAQNRGSGERWTSFAIFNRFTLAPFFNHFDIKPRSRLSAAVVACDRCIAALIACVVVAQP